MDNQVSVHCCLHDAHNVYKTWMACQSYFIFLIVHTHNAENVYRLPLSVGLTQACPTYNNILIYCMAKTIIAVD